MSVKREEGKARESEEITDSRQEPRENSGIFSSRLTELITGKKEEEQKEDIEQETGL